MINTGTGLHPGASPIHLPQGGPTPDPSPGGLQLYQIANATLAVAPNPAGGFVGELQIQTPIGALTIDMTIAATPTTATSGPLGNGPLMPPVDIVGAAIAQTTQAAAASANAKIEAFSSKLAEPLRTRVREIAETIVAAQLGDKEATAYIEAAMQIGTHGDSARAAFGQSPFGGVRAIAQTPTAAIAQIIDDLRRVSTWVATNITPAIAPQQQARQGARTGAFDTLRDMASQAYVAHYKARTGGCHSCGGGR